MSGIRDIFVITETEQAYDMIIDSARVPWDYEIKHKMVHRIENAEHLRGIPAPARIFCVGKFERRPDWQELLEAIIIGRHAKLEVR